jgi:hypothetical protein
MCKLFYKKIWENFSIKRWSNNEIFMVLTALQTIRRKLVIECGEIRWIMGMNYSLEIWKCYTFLFSTSSTKQLWNKYLIKNLYKFNLIYIKLEQRKTETIKKFQMKKIMIKFSQNNFIYFKAFYLNFPRDEFIIIQVTSFIL